MEFIFFQTEVVSEIYFLSLMEKPNEYHAFLCVRKVKINFKYIIFQCFQFQEKNCFILSFPGFSLLSCL